MANVLDEDDANIDMEAERRLQGFIFGLKQQADQLMTTDKFDDAIRLYRGLLVHLTKSQVKMAKQKDIVISCRMNVLGAMSKLEQWRELPAECEHVFSFLNDIKSDLEKTMSQEQLQAMQAQILGRVFYFRGFALMKMGGFVQADHDFKIAMQMLPNVDAIKDDWKQVQGALYLENRVKELMNSAMGHFQTNNFDVAVATCKEALVEANKLQKHELTALIHGNLAAACTRAEKHDDALEHFLLAIELTKKMDMANWSDRLFDLMEGATSIYMRQGKLPQAYELLSESVALFPKCAERQERAHAHFLNLGRVCFAMDKYDEAEGHFMKSQQAADQADDLDGTLHLMSWLGKVYVEKKEFAKLEELVDKAFVITLKEKKDDMHAVFLLLWLPIMEAKAHTKTEFKEVDTAKLLAAFQFFGHKRLLNGLLRVMQLLVTAAWGDDASDADKRAKRDEILSSLDQVKVEGVIGADAQLLAKLALIRVDIFASRGAFPLALAVVKDVLHCIKKHEVSTKGLREMLLQRFAELSMVSHQGAAEENTGEETTYLDVLDESLDVLRRSHSSEGQQNVAVLSSSLVRVAQWELQKKNGDISRAERLLDEAIALLQKFDGENAQQLMCHALVGACVLQIKKGNRAKAQELMDEIDKFPFSASWTQLQVIKAQLSPPAAAAATPTASAEKEKEKKPVVKAAKKEEKKEDKVGKPVVSNKETPAAPGAEAKADMGSTTPVAVKSRGGISGALAAWWDEYWFALSVLLVAIVFYFVITQEEEPLVPKP